MKYNRGNLTNLINLRDYEVQKVISDQLRTLAWAIAGIYTYLGVSENKVKAGIIVFLLWLFCMICSLIILTMAQKQKINSEGK